MRCTRACAGAGGKHHSVVVTQDGQSWAAGLNAQGQLGLGSIKKGKGVTEGARASRCHGAAAACMHVRTRSSTAAPLLRGSTHIYTTAAPAVPLAAAAAAARLCRHADVQFSFVRCQVEGAARVSCGVDFTAWLTRSGQVRGGMRRLPCARAYAGSSGSAHAVSSCSWLSRWLLMCACRRHCAAALQVLTAGNPQYGQLGDGSDHMYNAKDSE